jgi:hypothetical protein
MGDIEKITKVLEYEDNNIMIYPNPVSDYIYLNTQGVNFNRIIIYSTSGIKEMEIPFKARIDISQLVSGIHNLILYGDKNVVIKKLMKI